MLSYSINDTYRPDENQRGPSAGSVASFGRKKRAALGENFWSDVGDTGDEEEDEGADPLKAGGWGGATTPRLPVAAVGTKDFGRNSLRDDSTSVLSIAAAAR
jgi:hypothetical protein